MIVSEYLSLLVISILIMYPSSISERSCHHRLTAEDILELMDNSDIDLSDDETNLAEMEREAMIATLTAAMMILSYTAVMLHLTRKLWCQHLAREEPSGGRRQRLTQQLFPHLCDTTTQEIVRRGHQLIISICT